MTRYPSRNTLSALLAAVFLATPVAGSLAFAQDAMMLETIGAVRMLSPAEVQRRDGATTERAQPVTNSKTMWFADASTTAYYTLDHESHEFIARFEAGPTGGSPIVVRHVLGDGAVEHISIDGTNGNRIRATLTVRRDAGMLGVEVTTEQLPLRQASN